MMSSMNVNMHALNMIYNNFYEKWGHTVIDCTYHILFDKLFG